LKQVESEGGYAKAVAQLSRKGAGGNARGACEGLFSRRRALVGVNNYPDVTERRPARKFRWL